MDVQSLMDAKQTDGIINFRRWMARTLGEKNCGKLLWLWEFCGSEEMGLECDGNNITAVGALDTLVDWLRNSTGREAKVARLESLKDFPDEYLILLKDGIFLMLFKELLEGRLRAKILLDVAPKGKARDKWKESTEAKRTEGFASRQCGYFRRVTTEDSGYN